MKTFSRIFLILTAVIALSWFLPWIYSFALPDASREPFASLSPITGKYLFTLAGDNNSLHIYELDENGNETRTFTRNQRDSLLPQLYYRDLMAREQLPDTIAGLEITLPIMRHAEMTFVSSPRDINKVFPRENLMMESMPLRVDLEDPKETFTIDGEMVFIDMATNTVNRPRSDRFSKALGKAGISYPVKWLNANPTTRKQYDEGYLIIDADGKLFHVKQQAGRPYVASVKLPEGVTADLAFILEPTDRSYLGIVTDTDHNLYFLMREGYELERLDIGKVNMRKQRLAMLGNMFNITFRISDADTTRWRTVSRDDHRALASYDFAGNECLQSKISGYLFPFVLDFTTTNDMLAYPRINDISYKAIWLNLLLAISIACIYRRRHQSARSTVIASSATIFLGIFLFLPLLLKL